MKYLIVSSIFLFLLNSKNIFAESATSSVLKDTATGAATGAVTSYGAQKIAENLFPELSQKFGSALASPEGVAVVSAIGGLNAYTLYDAASTQIDDSERNIKKIETLMQTFTDSWASYCPNGRNDLKEPACYCYLDSGKKNTNRSNSQTCQQLWATNDAKVTAIASDYKGASTANDPTGCLTTSGQFDESCKCKKFVDSKGNNACQKVSGSVAINDSGFASTYFKNSGAGKLIDTANQLAQGNIGLSNLNGNSLARFNSRQLDMKHNLIDQMAGQLKAKNRLKYESDSDVLKGQNAIFSKKDLDKAKAMTSSNLASLSPSTNPTLEKNVKAIQQKAGLELTGTGKGTGKKEENKNMNFNFNDPTSANNNGSNNVEFAEKNYKYKNSDISKDNGATIFEIISNRYLESGINKLFKDDK